MTIIPPTEPIFSDKVTHVQIEDETAGEFIVLRQGENTIGIDYPEEWEQIKKAVEAMGAKLGE